MTHKKVFNELDRKITQARTKKILNSLKGSSSEIELIRGFCNSILKKYKIALEYYEKVLNLGIPKGEEVKFYLNYAYASKMEGELKKSLSILETGNISFPNKKLKGEILKIKRLIVKNNRNNDNLSKNNAQPINYKIPSIILKNYTKVFKKFVATKNVSFTVGHGVIHGFIGPNGSGKTTSIKAMIGAYISKKGQISINGHPAGSANANSLIGYIPERASFPRHLNCVDYLATMAELSGLKVRDAKAKAMVILKNLGLERHAKRKPFSFSSGMQKKILLAQALITDPDILILDEPAANLDPTARKELFDELIKLRKQGKTILLSSHILAELERLINEVTFIYHGKVMFSGKISEIENSNSDVFIKTTNNREIADFIKSKHERYKISGDFKTEIIVENLSARKTKVLFQEICSYPNINIKSLRANDLQSIYDKLVLQAETEERIQIEKEKMEIAKEKEAFLLMTQKMNIEKLQKKSK
jgi:ABC-type multidrug transport system ATPase subunit